MPASGTKRTGHWSAWCRRIAWLTTLWSGLAWAWLWTAQAAAREPVHVILWRPAGGDIFIDEVVVRTLGELNALGFRAQTTTEAPQPWPAADHHTAVLRLRQRPGEIVVDAWCPDCGLPLSQTMPAFAADASPDVVAVRAVDVLRAAMLEFSERTRTKPPANGARSQVRVPAPSGPPAKPSVVSSSAPTPWKMEVNLAAGWLRELGRPGSEFGLTSAVGMQRGSFGVGLRVYLPAASQTIESASGSVDPQRWRAVGYLQALLPLGDDWWTGLQAGAGAAWYRLSPTPAAGYEATQQTHRSPVLFSHLQLRRWFLPHVGAQLTVGVAMAIDTPIVIMAEREVTRLDAPALESGIGLLLRLP